MRNVWVATDLHLWSKDDDLGRNHPYRSAREIGIIEDGFGSEIQDDDTFIFLGDLCDPGKVDIDAIRGFVSNIKGFKIMCRGNHDTETYDFYRACGFDYVVDVLRIHNLLFSHKPIKVAPDEINIHGHVHTAKMSVLGQNHVNAYCVNWTGGPMLLDDLLDGATIQNYVPDARESHQIEKDLRDSFDIIDQDGHGGKYINVLDLSDRFPLVPIDEVTTSSRKVGLTDVLELLEKLNGFDYGFMDADGKRLDESKMTEEDFNKGYVLQHPWRFEKTRCGICWDYVAYEAYWFHRNLPEARVNCYYNVHKVADDYMPSHTFLTFNHDGKWYYLESSWGQNQGLWSADTEDALLADIERKLRAADGRIPRDCIGELYRYDAMSSKSFGMNVYEFMSWVEGGQRIPNPRSRGTVRRVTEDDATSLQETVSVPHDLLDEIMFQTREGYSSDAETRDWMKDDDSRRKHYDDAAQNDRNTGVALHEAAVIGTRAPTFEDLVQVAEDIHGEYLRFNDRYPAGNQNCLLCTWAAEMRLRGEDMLPRPVYSPSDIIFTIPPYAPFSSTKRNLIRFSSKSEARRIVEKDPSARFYVHVNWKGVSGGHEFLFVNVDGKGYVLDAQAGKVTPIISKDANEYFDINYDNSYMIRIDGRGVNVAVLRYNDYTYVTPWDEEKDIEYMRANNMLESMTIPDPFDLVESVVTAIDEAVAYRNRNNPHIWRPLPGYVNEAAVINEASFINDEGKRVPKTCPKCGSDVKVMFAGEPIYRCSNEKCKEYFGVVQFPNESAVQETNKVKTKEQKTDAAHRYDFRDVGNTHEYSARKLADDEMVYQNYLRKKEEAKKRREGQRIAFEAKVERLKGRVGEALDRKRAERVTGRRKSKMAKIPGIKNEDVDTVDNAAAALDTELDEPNINGPDRLHSDNRKYAFRSWNDSPEVFSESVITLLDGVQFFDHLDETTSRKNVGGLSPVYVLLVHSGTPVSKIIKGVTGAEFSHAAISFDSSLEKLYSFGSKKDYSECGFTIEGIHSGKLGEMVRDHRVPFALFVVPSTDSEVGLMKKRLEFFTRNKSKFRFDQIGLVKTALGISDNPEYRYFCSRFVADILRAGRPNDEFLRDPSLVKPEDFKRMSTARFVTSGTLNSYVRSEIDRIVKKILAEEKVLRSHLVESFDYNNPWQREVLNYKISTLDESGLDDFISYLKSFKIRFDGDGNVIISRREYNQLEHHFRESLRMIRACESSGNIEGVKEELYRINYLIELINTHYLAPGRKQSPRVNGDLRKDMMDLRSVMMNAFGQHLSFVTTREPNYNFQIGYSGSVYGKDIKIPRTVLATAGKTIVTALG